MGRKPPLRSLRNDSLGVWVMRKPVLIAATFLAFAIGAPSAQAATYTGAATAFAVCDGSTTMTASGRQVRLGYVANNWLPLGSWIELLRPKVIQSRTFYQVMDRGGPAFALDIWTDDCGWMNSWGRRTVKFRSVPKSELYRGKPYKGWSLRKGSRGARLVWRPR